GRERRQVSSPACRCWPGRGFPRARTLRWEDPSPRWLGDSVLPCARRRPRGGTARAKRARGRRTGPRRPRWRTDSRIAGPEPVRSSHPPPAVSCGLTSGGGSVATLTRTSGDRPGGQALPRARIDAAAADAVRPAETSTLADAGLRGLKREQHSTYAAP